ncbi:TPA: hypothetical protein ACYX6H_000616 [Klebsiella variicola]
MMLVAIYRVKLGIIVAVHPHALTERMVSFRKAAWLMWECCDDTSHEVSVSQHCHFISGLRRYFSSLRAVKMWITSLVDTRPMLLVG